MLDARLTQPRRRNEPITTTATNPCCSAARAGRRTPGWPQLVDLQTRLSSLSTERPSTRFGTRSAPSRTTALRHREEELFRQHRPISHSIKTRRKVITAFKTAPVLDTPFAKSRVIQTTRNQKESEADTRLPRSKVCWGPWNRLSGSRPYIPTRCHVILDRWRTDHNIDSDNE